MPDVETSSADYARRFSGPAGSYLLEMQLLAFKRALAGLAPGKALDVGGGHGQLVGPLQRMGWEVTVHGSQPVCGQNLRQIHGHLTCQFISSDLFALPFPDQSFDLVTAIRLISHVQDWPRLLKEMCRLARLVVVIDYPSKNALNALTPLMFGLKKSLEGNTRTYLSFTRRELTAVFRGCGFEAVGQHKELLLPMVLHRVARGMAPVRALESVARTLGLTALAGSPVILRADRRAPPGG